MAGRDFYGVYQLFNSVMTLAELLFCTLRNALRVYDMESVMMSKQGIYYQ
jgi:hypothetical protein